MIENQWNTALYEGRHGFVWQYGEEVLAWLSPQPGEWILDLGCGTGQLTEKLRLAGVNAIGIDSAPSMIEQARRNYPQIEFFLADARNFQVEQPLNAVFSNAVLHWIPDADAVIRSIYRALKPGGRFVADFGGHGDVQSIITALYEALREVGVIAPETLSPWYFPSIGEYATRLEGQGFEVTQAALIDRPTPLCGDAGLATWMQMFANRFLERLSAEQQNQVIQATEHHLRPTLYRDGQWWADYRRIRIVAVRV